jgi:uncharacterized protein
MFDLTLLRSYARAGLGLGGGMLKQSLYPADALLPVLDGANLVLDFGCGEGLLTNTLARKLPRTRFIGIDLDEKKIALAQTCGANERVEFRAGDFFHHAAPRGADVIIFNDVLHHLPLDRQVAALQHATDCLHPHGVILLKEVNPADALDVKHTTFWDTKLYPADSLQFVSPEIWIERMRNLGFRTLGRSTVRHPWIASRTLLWFTRRPKLFSFAPALPVVHGTAEKAALVTGGTGFIGEWVVRQLLQEGLNGASTRVDLITRQPGSVPHDLAVHQRVRVITGDLTDPEFAPTLTGPYDAVFHLAAAVDYFGGEKVYANNLQTTTRLIAACEKIPCGRFVYTSTMGALDRSRWDFAGKPLTEVSPPHPTSPYGRAKVAEEALIKRSKLSWTIVRIPWCYGPGMAESHHVRNLLNRVRQGSAACRLHWPGRVSLVEVRSAAREIVASATSQHTARETFFLAEDSTTSVGELFAEMGRTIGAPAAGSIHLPSWLWKLLRLALPIAPFQLKCLMTDALSVSNEHARSLGVDVPVRPADWLVPLARYNALQTFPSRHAAPALITGAAGGIGACLARQLYARGYSLILADRNESALAEKCRSYGAYPWMVDLAAVSLPEHLAATFPFHLPWPALLINNAGVGWRGDAWDASAAECQRVIAVNATAPAVLSNYFLQKSPQPLTIANVASTAAFQPLPHMAAYAAAKSFILSYSLALQAELAAGNRADFVITVVPAGTQTGFQAAAGVKTNEKEKLLSPDAVASSILEGISRKRGLLFVGSRARMMSLMAAVLPLGIQAKFWEKLMRSLR